MVSYHSSNRLLSINEEGFIAWTAPFNLFAGWPSAVSLERLEAENPDAEFC